MSILNKISSSSGSDRSIPSLDGFRAIAIWIVMLGHLVNSPGVPQWLARVLHFFISAQTGVTIFFVISGFLITTLLLREKRKFGTVNIRKFYIRRALRILPVSYLYILVIWYFNRTFLLGINRILFIHAWTYTMNFVVVGTWLLGHLWSLGVEEQFYLFWPWLTRFSVPVLKKLAWALIVAAPLIRGILLFYPGLRWVLIGPFLTYSDSLMIGCLLAAAYENRDSWWDSGILNHRPIRILCTGIILLMSTLIVHGWGNPLFVMLNQSVTSIATCYLIACAIHIKRGRMYAFLNTPWLSYTGVISYSLYIWQEPFLYDKKWIHSDIWWRQFPFNLIAVFAVAALSYHIWEKFFLRLKSFFKMV